MFSHWSKTRFELEPRNYKTVALDRLFTHGKPHGLWFDVDGDWQRWCEAEGFATDRFEWRHVLTLDMSRMIQFTQCRRDRRVHAAIHGPRWCDRLADRHQWRGWTCDCAVLLGTTTGCQHGLVLRLGLCVWLRVGFDGGSDVDAHEG